MNPKSYLVFSMGMMLIAMGLCVLALFLLWRSRRNLRKSEELHAQTLKIQTNTEQLLAGLPAVSAVPRSKTLWGIGGKLIKRTGGPIEPRSIAGFSPAADEPRPPDET